MDLNSLQEVGDHLNINVSAALIDAAGNPVADGTRVFFDVKAMAFDEDRDHDFTPSCWDENRNLIVPCPPADTPGFGVAWFSDDVNQDGKMYGCDNIRCLKGPLCASEDINHNDILDPGEDKNHNGVLDPPRIA